MWMKVCIDPRASGDVSEIRMSPTACAGHLNEMQTLQSTNRLDQRGCGEQQVKHKDVQNR